MTDLRGELAMRIRLYLNAAAESKRQYNKRTLAARLADDEQHAAGQGLLGWLKAHPELLEVL